MGRVLCWAAPLGTFGTKAGSAASSPPPKSIYKVENGVKQTPHFGYARMGFTPSWGWSGEIQGSAQTR